MWSAVLFWGMAHATPLVDRRWKGNLLVGVDLLVNLGPAEDRKRFGVAFDAGIQGIWHDSPYGSDDFRLEPSPVWQAMVTAGLSPGLVYTDLTLQGGGLYPMEVADAGYIPGIALMGGGGIGMSTDGFAGVLATGSVASFLAGGRFAVDRWQGGWHAPRLTVGAQLPVNCCAYLE